MKKQIAIAIGATTMIASPALARTDDDDWTGFYIGAHATGSQDKIDISGDVIFSSSLNATATSGGPVVQTISSTFPVPIAASDRDTGFSGGGFAGYQRQIGRVVIGLEGDFAPFRRSITATYNRDIIFQSASTQSASSGTLPINTLAFRRDVRVDAQWSARARLGYAFGKTLIYATGGYARANARVTSIDSVATPGGQITGCSTPPCRFIVPFGPVVVTASESKSLSGWTAGGGLEQKLGKNFSIGIEYRRTDMRRTFALANQTLVNNTVPAPGYVGGGLTTDPNRVRLTSSAVNVRVAFHF